MNKVTGNINSTVITVAFDRMEAKVNQQLDASSAMQELNESQDTLDANVIADKYASGTQDVDDELERLKAEMSV